MNTKDTGFRVNKTLCLRGNFLSLDIPQVMGILNVTPDSFYDGGQYTIESRILTRAEQILSEGATFTDIGGYSTRPHAAEVSEEEELARVIPAIETIIRRFPEAYLSIDTFRSGVARRAVEAGAALVNDISGGTLDTQMFETVSRLNVPYVLMHSRGNPKTMTQLTDYSDVVLDVLDDLQRKVHQLRTFGQKDIVLDVGFGFAKTPAQSYTLLQYLDYFDILGLPMLVGVSRKSMVYKTLGVPPEESLNGTTVLNTIALLKGASILRVHDVKFALQAVTLYRMTTRVRSQSESTEPTSTSVER